MKKKCSTCLHYQASPVGGQGWCRNPVLRKPHERTLVGANELACDKKFYDFWQPIRPGARELARGGARASAAWDVASVLSVRDVTQYLVYLAVLAIVVGLVGLNVLFAARSGTAAASPTAVAKPTAVVATTVKPTAPATAATPAPTPIPPTPTPFQTYRVVIANTNREGLVVRAEPGGERKLALPEGTELTVIGPDREHEGRVWKNVRDARGNAGWVPEEFTQRR